MTFAEALMLLYPKGIPTSSYSDLETELSVIFRLVIKSKRLDTKLDFFSRCARGGFTPREEVSEVSPVKYQRKPRHTPENLLPELRAALGKRRWKATPVLMAELGTSRKMLLRVVELLRQEPGFEERGNHHKKYRLRNDPIVKNTAEKAA